MAKRALIVGAGGMGRAWGRTLAEHPDTEICGWVDLRPEAATDAAAQQGLNIPTSDDLPKAIEQTSPDFVVDVTVPDAHCDVTVTALGMGVPLLGEKPMAHSMEAARKMVAASEASGKLYMVSQSRRYDARIVAYRKLIERIGWVGVLNADFFLGPRFGGFRDEMPSPLVLDMAIHTFDAARYLIQADPVSVYCEEHNPKWSWYQGDASAVALFEMTGGARYDYRGSWCAEGLPTSWEAQWRAIGSEGTALWDGHADLRAEVVRSDAPGFMREGETLHGTPEDGKPGGIAGALVEFLNALETGAKPMGECHDNIKSLAMVFGAIESARTGKRVPIVV